MIQPVTYTPSNRSVSAGVSTAKNVSIAPDLKRTRSKEASTLTKVASALGAVAGAGIAVGMYAKRQNVKPLELEYGLREMLGVGLGGIAGGVLGGVLTSPKKKFERKLDEGIFQYSMVALPGVAVSGAMLACDKFKALNNTPAKIAATSLALAGGLEVAVDAANFVSDINNEEPDRKLTFKDAIASLDDFIGILVLAKIKAVKKLHLDKMMPAIYAYCGYKSGTRN